MTQLSLFPSGDGALHPSCYPEIPKFREEVEPKPRPDSTADCYRRLMDAAKRALDENRKLDNPRFTALADEAFGGSIAQGKYQSRDAYDAMEAGFHEWLRDRAGELWGQAQQNAAQVVDRIARWMSCLPTQTARTEEQVTHQQFSTPPTHALVAALALNPRTEDVILEPSAGTGSLLIFPSVVVDRKNIHANEIAPRRRELLKQMGYRATGVDAEQLNNLLPRDLKPTAILMNPPFSATAGRLQKNAPKYGFRHLEQALARVAEGGRVVAILGENVALTCQSQLAAWERITGRYNVRANIGIAGKLYRKYGTSFGSQLIIVDKSGPTPGASFAERVRAIRSGSYESLEVVLDAISQIAADRGAVNAKAATPSQRGVQGGASVANGTCRQAASSAAKQSQSPKPEDETGTYVRYQPYPSIAEAWPEHPAQIVESGPMSAVHPPAVTYRSSLPGFMRSNGLLSDLQAESVCLAGQRHQTRLPNGSIGGFFIGDGTGVGKGRQVAAIVLDNRAQGRKKALWVSASKDLLEDAKRDLRDLGAREVPIALVNDFKTEDRIHLPDGIVFTTYASLIGKSRKEKGRTRLKQIEEWLGEEPVIILDEAHKAKNALCGGMGEPTQTGVAVVDLQEHIPGARVVYASATGATDVRNMAYMTRLGIWGPGTAFPGGFQQFLSEIEGGGVGAMEMACRDLKALGMYTSRSISYEGVAYREARQELTAEQREVYDAAAGLWRTISWNVMQAIEATGARGRARAYAVSNFWSNHQRFFRQLVTAFKVPVAIREAEKALEDGHSVVMSLIGTGESRTAEQVTKAKSEGADLEDLDFTPVEVIRHYLDKMFPTVQYTEVQSPTDPERTVSIPLKDEHGDTVTNVEAEELREKMIDLLSQIRLPDNPLDQIVQHFGPEKVAELTGRKKRLIRSPKTGKIEYASRKAKGVAVNKMNVHEMAMFQRSEKRVAIISDAASTGISLHASNRARNSQQRTHIVLELGWSADKQLQSFGRTHRSDQAAPPEYVLLSTDVGGEKRFSSTIASRLESLGALTKGSRTASGSGDELSKYNFESSYGSAAVHATYTDILQGRAFGPEEFDGRQALRDMGILRATPDGSKDIAKEDRGSVKKFLNRVLALEVERQNILFEHFYEHFDRIVRQAKADGTFDDGVSNVKAESIRLAQSKEVYRDAATGAVTEYLKIDAEFKADPVSWDRVRRLVEAEKSQIYRNKRTGKFVLGRASGSRTDAATGEVQHTFAMTKPGKENAEYIKEVDLKSRYSLTDAEAAETWWRTAFEKAPRTQTRKLHVLSGAVLPLWDKFRAVQATNLRIVRMNADDGQRIIGIQIPAKQVGQVLGAIGVTQAVESPEEVYRGVYEEGGRVALAESVALRRVNFRGDTAIELLGADRYKFAELKHLGLIKEQDRWAWRWFVPSERETAVRIIGMLLKRWPATGIQVVEKGAAA